MAIRYGRGGYSGYECQSFADDSYIIVCSPDFLKSCGTLEKPSDTLDKPLIETNWQIESDAAPAWRDWYQRHNLTAPGKPNRFSVTLEAHAVRAAVGAQGLALCHQLYADAELKKGTLVQLFEGAETLKPIFKHYLVWRKYADTAYSRQFRSWIEKRFGAV